MSEAGTSVADRMKERMERLKKLHNARNEARVDNHKETVAEDERNKLPKNWEAKKRQADWLIDDKKARDVVAEKGLDYDRVKLLNVSAVEAERVDKLKSKKKNGDPGFSDYESATARQYQRLIKSMPPPDMDKYERQKEELGDNFYGGSNPVLFGLHKDSKQAVDKMVKDLDGQIAKRKKYSRRRTHNDDEDISYINDRNARFNKKLDRFYGEYTQEIKQNLERGTAI